MLLLPLPPVLAQNLANFPGLTEVQQPVASAIQVVCARFAPGGYVANPVGTPAERLFFTCRSMVQTANDLTPGNTLPTGASLKITSEQLRVAVQAVGPVQMNAQKQLSIETSKANLLLTRLVDLRSGARGVLSGSNGGDGKSVSLASNQSLIGARGGGASADPALEGPVGVFANAGYNQGNVDATVRQDGYDFHNSQFLIGVDYRVSNAFILGAAVGYNETRSTFDQSLGNVDSETTSVSAYGTYYKDAWYVDGVVSFGSVAYDTVRNIAVPSNSASPNALPINTSARASPKGSQWSASIGVGRDFAYPAVTISPVARLSYLWVKNDAFTEEEPNNGLGLAVDSRTVSSLQSALGAKLSTVVSTGSGVFGPYIAAHWLHEFKNGVPSITARYVQDPFNPITFLIPAEQPDRDYAVVSLGSSVTLPGNWSGFVQVITALGISNVTNNGIIAGIRKQF